MIAGWGEVLDANEGVFLAGELGERGGGRGGEGPAGEVAGEASVGCGWEEELLSEREDRRGFWVGGYGLGRRSEVELGRLGEVGGGIGAGAVGVERWTGGGRLDADGGECVSGRECVSGWEWAK